MEIRTQRPKLLYICSSSGVKKALNQASVNRHSRLWEQWEEEKKADESSWWELGCGNPLPGYFFIMGSPLQSSLSLHTMIIKKRVIFQRPLMHNDADTQRMSNLCNIIVLTGTEGSTLKFQNWRKSKVMLAEWDFTDTLLHNIIKPNDFKTFAIELLQSVILWFLGIVEQQYLSVESKSKKKVSQGRVKKVKL